MFAVSPLRDQPEPRRRSAGSAPARRSASSTRVAPARRHHDARERVEPRDLRDPQRRRTNAPQRSTDRVPLLRRPPATTEPNSQHLPRGARPLTRTTTAAEREAARRAAPARPRLEVVPHRRRALGIVVASCIVLFGLLLGAVAFQTKLAQNQLALDRTERAVRDARERYDILRRQRAQLRSPNRLAVEAERLGMVPAETGELMTIDPAVAAAVAIAASGLPDDVSTDQGSSLDQFGEVKAVTGDAP